VRGAKIWLSQELRDDLERFARSRTLPARLVQRAQIVVLAAARNSDPEIAQTVGVVLADREPLAESIRRTRNRWT